MPAPLPLQSLLHTRFYSNTKGELWRESVSALTHLPSSSETASAQAPHTDATPSAQPGTERACVGVKMNVLTSDRLGELLGKSLAGTVCYPSEQESNKENGEGPRHSIRSSLLWFHRHPPLRAVWSQTSYFTSLCFHADSFQTAASTAVRIKHDVYRTCIYPKELFI